MAVSSAENDAWAAEMSREARAMMEMWYADPALLDERPMEALEWLDGQLAEVDTRTFDEEELPSIIREVMALVAEVVIGVHGARWGTGSDASATDRHVLLGGGLKAPVRIESVVVRGFRVPTASAVAMFEEAEREGGVREGGVRATV